MKRVTNGRRTLTGQITNNTYNGSENRIQLFDGRFDTGYKIISFQITPEIPAAAQEITAKLSTEAKSTVTAFNWQDVEEVAWAFWSSDQATLSSIYTNVREDSMIIEDLWVSCGGADSEMNYEIILEKYTFDEWVGPLAMVKNRSQA